MVTSTPRRKLFARPATLALAVEGSSPRDIAEAAGVSRSYVSQMLAGARPVTAPVRAAMTDVVGDEGARRVLALIPGADDALAA